MRQSRKGFHRHALAAAVVLALAGAAAQAQVGTSTIKGLVASAQAGKQVVAVNKDNGSKYKTSTLPDGSYVLSGLAPGRYEIQVDNAISEVVTVSVGETAAVDLALAGTQQVTVTGKTARLGMRDSQVGTAVSRTQIESIPQITRNFLAFADLAPGVRFEVDGGGYTRMQSGAQSANNVNVFIDGVGQKNYVLKGGISGQDTSRGNPFPQSAIAEYKVISQNYKAEFDQVSSAAITAVTKSGTNEFHGDVFIDYTNNSLTSKDPFQKAKEAAGTPRPEFSQVQYGASLGGPIIKDQIHFFMALEGKDNSNPRQATLQNTTGLTITPLLSSMTGSATSKFKETVFFGKVDAQLAEDQHLEVSTKIRDENDTVPENDSLSAVNNVKNRSNNEARFDIKHELMRDQWINELRLSYEESTWKPQPGCADQPYIEYKRTNWSDIIRGGCSPDNQSKGQKGLMLQDDFTYTGAVGHTIKTGMKVKSSTMDLTGTNWNVNHIGRFVQDDGTVNQTLNPDAVFDAAVAPVTASYKNSMFGVFAQDDWKLTKQLELNLGLRWDYETNMLNNDYVTPAHIVGALNAIDTRTGASAGQTYAQSLAAGGININEYISNGSNRKPFSGAIQPRVGASYDIFNDQASVLFGGWGRAYDRTMANFALDELYHNKSTTGDIFLINNNLKMPYSDQFSFGLRQQVADWNAEIGYTNSYQHNGFIWTHGNRSPSGASSTSPIDPLWGNAPGHSGNLVLGDFIIKTKTDTVYLKAEKPYTRSSGWSASFTYTYSDGKTNSTTWESLDTFSWAWGKPAGTDLHPTQDVEKHRVVATGIVDLGEGFRLSGKATWGSGKPVQLFDCTATCTFVAGKLPEYQQLDLGIAKEFGVGGSQKVALRLDVLNVLDTVNYDGLGKYPWDSNYKQTTGVGGNAMRTFKLGLSYKF